MALSRKHYREIAGILAAEYDAWNSVDAKAAVSNVASELAIMLKQDNPAFNKQKFFDYIEGVKSDG